MTEERLDTLRNYDHYEWLEKMKEFNDELEKLRNKRQKIILRDMEKKRTLQDQLLKAKREKDIAKRKQFIESSKL